MEKDQKIVKVDGEKLKKKLAELDASMHKISLYILGKSKNYLREGLARGFIKLEEVEKIAKFYGLNANDYFIVEEPKRENEEPKKENEEPPKSKSAESPNTAFNDENILIHLSKIERLLIDLISATKRNTIELEKHTMELKSIKAKESKNE